jgi:predicted Fe-Mo cluster-binding NifX family protein
LKIGVAAEDGSGLQAEISRHFGRCPYYVILEAEEEKVEEPVRVIANPYATAHGEPGQVPSFLKEQGIEVIIAGGMGPRAVGFFDQYRIKVATGASGKVNEAVKSFLKGELKSGEPCH